MPENKTSTIAPFSVYFWLFLAATLSPAIHSKIAIYGTIVHRVLYFWFLIDIALFFVLFRMKRMPKRLHLDWFSLGLLVFLFLSFVANVIGISPFNSFFSSFERMNGFLTFFHFVCFYFVFKEQKFTSNDWIYILSSTLLVGMGIGLFGWFERNYKEDGRLQSVLSNPMHLAGYMNLLIFIGLASLQFLFQNRHKIWAKSAFFIELFILFFFSIILLMSKTRAGLFGLLVGLVVVLLCLALQQKARKKWTLGGVVVLIGMCLFIYTNRERRWVIENPVLNKMTDLSLQTQTISYRLKIWKMTWDGVSDRPILGWGQGNFTPFFAKHFEPQMYDVGLWYDSSHNFLLDKIIDVGFVGLLAYLFLMGAYLFLIWNTLSQLSVWEKSVFTGMFFAYYIFLFFGFESFGTSLLFFGSAVFIAQKQSKKFVFILPQKMDKIIFPVGVTVVVLMTWQFVIRSWNSNAEITEAYHAPSFENMVALHEKAYQNALIGKYDVALQYASKNQEVAISNLPVNDVENFQNSVEKMMGNALEFYPNHPVLLSQLGFVETIGGAYKKGIATYQKIAEIAPNRPANLIDLGVFYAENKEVVKAFEVFERVNNLDTSYQIPRLYMSLALAKLGMKSNAIQYLYSVNRPDVIQYKNIISAVCNQLSEPLEYTHFISTIPNKSQFKQADFLHWAENAYAQNDTVQVRSAFVSYYKHFLPTTDSLRIETMIGKVKRREETPQIMTQFFSRFPNR